jgi:hypothetical protein
MILAIALIVCNETFNLCRIRFDTDVVANYSNGAANDY